MEIEKEVLKIVVVGHVDHGKSTLIGRLLYDTKSLPEGAVEKVKRISKEKGKPFEYAYLLDAFEEEQKQGITIDTTQLQFFTEKREYVIIDAPGHKEFLKNMISGAANAEAALLIIDAQEGIQEQSKRHGYMLSLLGIQKVYVIVNKMDLIDYSKEKFDEIKSEMNKYLNNLDVFPLKYIPISAFYGENMTEKSLAMPWYQGEPVLEAIDLFEKETGLEAKPLRFPIQDVYKFDNRRIIAGRIETGTLKVGDEVLITPTNKTTKVKTIEYFAERDKRDTVSAGMSVGITFEDEFFNQRGELITHQNTSPLIADSFKANLFWMGKNPLLRGQKYKLKLVTQEVECEIVYINKVIDATSLDTVEFADQVKTNDVAEVTIKTKEKISFDEFKNNQITGRFVLVDGYDVSGGGIVAGLVAGVQTATKLAKKDLAITVNCFDEYFYNIDKNQLQKIASKAITFKPDDILPITGDTYAYPENIAIIDLKQKLVAIVKKAKLQDILPLAEYSYNSAVPLIEANGSLSKVANETDYLQFREELQQVAEDTLDRYLNRWFDFGALKKFRYLQTVESFNGDFQI